MEREKRGEKGGIGHKKKRRVSQPSQGKARQGTKRGMRAKHACGHQPTCFVVVLPTTTPTHHSLSFVLSCLFPCPLPFPACVCVSVSDGGWAWWLVACGLVQAHVWPSRHHHSLALCLLPHPFFLSLLPPFLSFPLPLPLVVVVDEKRQVGRHAIHTPPSPLCLVPCVVVGLWVWCVVVLVGTPRLYGWHQWLWLVCLATGATHHACGASGASLCGAGVHVPTPFPTHSLTQAWHTTTPHTHTHGWWLVHFGPWCVCVCGHGVGCRRAWLATHTTTHSFCPTPLHQSSCCCCWWCWWMWWWQRGCCGVCGHLVHSLAVLVLSTPPSTHTHTHGVVGTWWWWLCVWCGCHHHCAPFPPTTTTVSAAPPCPLCACMRV